MTLSEIIAQLRSCNYECEAGPLENNVAWQALEGMAQSEEVVITEKLLQSRTANLERLLDAIPACLVHGNRCVPYALEWIESKKKGVDA